MTPSRRELILRKQFSNPDEHQATLLQSDELHPTKPDLCVTTGIVGEDDLIGRQRHFDAVREEDKSARGPLPIIGSVDGRSSSRSREVGAAKSMRSNMPCR